MLRELAETREVESLHTLKRQRSRCHQCHLKELPMQVKGAQLTGASTDRGPIAPSAQLCRQAACHLDRICSSGGPVQGMRWLAVSGQGQRYLSLPGAGAVCQGRPTLVPCSCSLGSSTCSVRTKWQMPWALWLSLSVQLCHCGEEAAPGPGGGRGCGCVPIKLYLQSQMTVVSGPWTAAC